MKRRLLGINHHYKKHKGIYNIDAATIHLFGYIAEVYKTLREHSIHSTCKEKGKCNDKVETNRDARHQLTLGWVCKCRRVWGKWNATLRLAFVDLECLYFPQGTFCTCSCRCVGRTCVGGMSTYQWHTGCEIWTLHAVSPNECAALNMFFSKEGPQNR